MDFNIILRPLRRLQDAVACCKLIKIFPNGIRNRILHIKETLNRFSEGQNYSTDQVALAVQKFDSVLPRYNDNPTDISDNVVEEMVERYILKDSQREVGVRNIFPPVQKCCDRDLDMRSVSRCIVFERCKGALQGQLFDGKCNACNKLYTANTIKNGEIEIHYKDVLDLPYFVSSRETVFDTDFLNFVDREM